jgi:hypothetical protein
VIGPDHLGFPLGLLGKVLDRQLGGDDRARSLEIGVDARHVVENADADGAVLFGGRRGDREEERQDDDASLPVHAFLPWSSFL